MISASANDFYRVNLSHTMPFLCRITPIPVQCNSIAPVLVHVICFIFSELFVLFFNQRHRLVFACSTYSSTWNSSVLGLEPKETSDRRRPVWTESADLRSTDLSTLWTCRSLLLSTDKALAMCRFRAVCVPTFVDFEFGGVLMKPLQSTTMGQSLATGKPSRMAWFTVS